MLIEWCGNSYFIFHSEKGVVLAIDPHDGGSLGLPKCRRDADYVLVTHNHFDHNAVDEAKGKRTREVLLWRTGEVNLGNIKVTGYRFYHDKAGGSLRGSVVSYKVLIDGMKLIHMSDIGHIPPEASLEPLKNSDVLIIPVGGVTTIDAAEACKLIEILKSKVVIPAHFWMPGMTVPYDPLDRFLSISKARRLRVDGGSLKLTKDFLPERTTVVIFEKTATGAKSVP